LLARLLTPAEFGIFAIVVFIRTFLFTFGDAGLAASLIREPIDPEEIEYRAVFTFQQIMVVGIVALFWVASPIVVALYGLPTADVWLFRLVALSLLCSSFQVIPTVRLERNLIYGKLASIEIAMAAVFNGSAVGLAWIGWGAMSFGVALLGRSLIGAVLANVVCPWRIRWSLAWDRVKPHLRFGLPYQGIAFLSLLKDSIGPLYIGVLLGASQMGYVSWASTFAAWPVLMVAVIQRVYMSAFSRMQNHPESLARFVERSIQATNAMVAPAAVLAIVYSVPITRIIFGTKWLVALPLFFLFWSGSLFVPTVIPLMSLLNALGHSRLTFLFSLTWMAGTWIVGVPFIWLWGALGYAATVLVVNFSNFLVYRAAKRTLYFRLLPNVVPVWAWATGLGLLAYGLNFIWTPSSVLSLVLAAGVYTVVYIGGLLARYAGDARKLWTLAWKQA
jgi:O-antigen/teichoic acid export membrane protein